MEITGVILQYVNLIMSITAMYLFLVLYKKYKDMRMIFAMLFINCLIMATLYILLLLNVELPSITGRINLTLVLTSLNLSSMAMIERSKK